MKLFSIIALFVVPFSVSIMGTRVTLDDVYSQGDTPLSQVACSDGANGLLTKGYNYFREVPGYPRLAGSSNAVWNSLDCGSPRFIEFDFVTHGRAHLKTGSCWNVTYNGTSVLVTVVDTAGADTFNLPLEAMNELTCADLLILLSRSFADASHSKGEAQQLGSVNGATASRYSHLPCGLQK